MVFDGFIVFGSLFERFFKAFYETWLGNFFEAQRVFMYDSCMSKTITIDDDVYELLRWLKQGERDSFTKVLRRNVHKPLDTCGELLDSYETDPPAHDAKLDVLRRIERERSRRCANRS